MALCEQKWFKNIEELDIRSCKLLSKEDVCMLKNFVKLNKLNNL